MSTPNRFDNGLANPRPPTKSPRAVELHIEELVLHGFAPGDRHAIAEAVRHELAHLIGESRLPISQVNPVALKQIDAGTFQVKDGSKPGSSGAQIAQSVFRSVRRQMRAAVSAPATRGAEGNKR